MKLPADILCDYLVWRVKHHSKWCHPCHWGPAETPSSDKRSPLGLSSRFFLSYLPNGGLCCVVTFGDNSQVKVGPNTKWQTKYAQNWKIWLMCVLLNLFVMLCHHFWHSWPKPTLCSNSKFGLWNMPFHSAWPMSRYRVITNEPCMD